MNTDKLPRFYISEFRKTRDKTEKPTYDVRERVEGGTKFVGTCKTRKQAADLIAAIQDNN